MICMTCNAKVTCPWEEDIDPVAIKAGWMMLEPREGRKHETAICGVCVVEIARLRLARLNLKDGEP